MNKNELISNKNISSCNIKQFHTEIILFPNETNNHICICSATLETDDGRQFRDIGVSQSNHLPDSYSDNLITMAADRAKKRVLSEAYHSPSLYDADNHSSGTIHSQTIHVDDTEPKNNISSDQPMHTTIDKNSLKGGGNKPITIKQKNLIESKSKKKGMSGNELSQKYMKKDIDHLTGEEADSIIKTIL